MTKRNLVQVVIGGKVLSMCGSDDEMHIQKVAACVNRKLSELEPTEGYRALPMDLRPVLVELNLADELIQAQDTIEMLKSDLQAMGNELAEVKQKLAETQVELEELESSAVQMTFSDVGWTPGHGDKRQGPQISGQKDEESGQQMPYEENAENLSGQAKQAVQSSFASNRKKSRKR